MITGAVLDAMLAAGCSAEQIVAAVKAHLNEQQQRDAGRLELDAARREHERLKKRAQRSVAKSTIVSPDVPGTNGMSPGQRGTTPTPFSPHPDKETPPLHPPKENNPSLFSPNPNTPSVSKETSGPPAFWFDDFWRLYPNKVGKPDAIKAFRRAAMRVDVDTLMAGLQAYVAKQDDRPWCNPSTWLNQDRWNDRPVPRRQEPKGLEWFDEAARWIEENEERRGTETGSRSDQAAALGPPKLAIVHRS